MYLKDQIQKSSNKRNRSEKVLSNFEIITNLRTNESGEEDLSFEWMKEQPLQPSADYSPLADISLDQLDRFSFAKKVAQAIEKRKNEGSITMGLYGRPGEGKTTVLNFLSYELSKLPLVISLRFNPSKQTSSPDLVKNFFETLSDAIGYSDEIPSSLRKKVVRLLDEYSSFLAPGSVEDPVQRRRRIFSKSPDEIKNNLEILFRRLERKIVFLVDDLDKTELNEVRSFFRLIRLSANFPNTVFVLFFDEATLSLELGGRNKKESQSLGRKVLEKVVHLALRIPPAGKNRLLEMCFNGISGILKDPEPQAEVFRMESFKEKFTAAFSSALKTPRDCSIYLGTLSDSLPKRAEGLDRLNFMLIEALRVFYPRVYEVIRNNPDTFIGVEINKAQRAELEENISLFAVNKALESVPEEEKKALRALLAYFFPCLSGITGFPEGLYPVQNPWIEEKPVASKQYFSRYFLLNTSGTDDFQREVDRLLLRSSSGEINELALSVRKLVRQAGADAFITGVENRIYEMSPVASGNLIRAFAQTGGSFLNPDTLFSFSTVYAHPAILIRKLLLNIPEGQERLSVAGFLMKESEPVSFAFECLRWMRADETEDRIFSPETEDELSAILSERIKSLAYRYPVYLTTPQEAPLLLSVWSFLGSKEETTRYLESTFRKEPGNVMQFLKCYMPEEWLEDQENELNGSFLLNLKCSVSGVIDSKLVYNQLEKAATSLDALPQAGKSLQRRLLKELAPISSEGHSVNHRQLMVFNINDYEKENRKNNSEAGTAAAESAKRSTLTQVSKGLYRPLIDLFN